jgi:hypothetical protein
MADIIWQTQEEIDKEKEEQEKQANLPVAEERLQAVEDSLLYLMMEG